MSIFKSKTRTLKEWKEYLKGGIEIGKLSDSEVDDLFDKLPKDYIMRPGLSDEHCNLVLEKAKPQQSMSNSVKKKFTELEEKIESEVEFLRVTLAATKLTNNKIGSYLFPASILDK